MTELRKMLLAYDGNECFDKIMEVLLDSHYTYENDGNQGIYDEYPFDELSCELRHIDENFSFDYTCGASKIVAVLNDVVLKIPFSGIAYDYDWLGNPLDEPEFKNYADYEPNYCEIEAKVYEEAKKIGIEDFFAETIKVNDKVYAQPRFSVDVMDYEDNDDTDYRGAAELRKLYRLTQIPLCVFDSWYKTYDSNTLAKFSKFISEHKINDLHEKNIALFSDGKFRLIDYSGFCSGTEHTF